MSLLTEGIKRKYYQTIVYTKDKEEKSIERIQYFKNNDSSKNILAFSGGKDSLALYILMVKSGIEFKAIYSPTSVDPPELVRYIKKFSDWAVKHGYPKIHFQKYNTWKTGPLKGQIKTMWSLLRHRAMPPDRVVRYCCDELKERTGKSGDHVFVGVRWEESAKRSKRGIVEFYKNKVMISPLIDWSQVEIWSLILSEKFPYCELYDKGFNRLGCIGCPLAANQSLCYILNIKNYI